MVTKAKITKIVKSIKDNNQGSLTVEASLVIPLVLMCVMFLVYIMEIYGVQSDINSAAFIASNKISTELSYGISFNNAYVERSVSENYSKSLKENKHIVSGVDGIKYNKSKLYPNGEFEICVEYNYKVPGIFWNTNGIKLCQKIQSRAFVGSANSDVDKVYITSSGSVYHTYRDCTYLNIKIDEVKLDEILNYRNAAGAKYYECTICNEEHFDGTNVYITTYGTSYHISKSCSSLKRDVKTIDISEVEGRRKCSKCALR